MITLTFPRSYNMSYSTYNGIIKARGGKGSNNPQCSANLSEIVTSGLSPEDAIAAYREKYGDILVADWICAHWKVLVQKAGQTSLKTDILAGIEPDLEKAGIAMVTCASGDMIPQRRGAAPKAPKLSSADIRAQAETAGIKGGKLDAFIQGLINSGGIKA